MIKLVFLSFIISFQTYSQGNRITIGEKKIIRSEILNEKRTLWIHVPKGFYANKNRSQKYPVIYLLDGDSHFSSIVGLNEFLSESNGNTLMPEMIIVGILNTDRNRDLTPTHISEDLPFMDSISCVNTGGGEKFTDFLEHELIPYINSNYPTTTYKMLIGHSLGGLTVVSTFLNHSELFNAYISIDPSLWWDNQKFVKDAAVKLKSLNLENKSFYLGIANTMDQMIDSSEIKKDTSRWSFHMRSIFEFDQLMKNNHSKIKYNSSYYPGDSHISSPMISEYDAFRFFFKDYEIKYSNADELNFNQETIQRLENHYRNLEKLFGYEVLPPEDMVNNWAYYTLSLDNFEEALYLFELNCKNYPNSKDAFVHLGDFYAKRGDLELAKLTYKKAKKKK